MQLISWTTPKMIICSEGKMIRSKNDTYSPAKYDEQGNLVPEHKPYYTTTIFVPDKTTEEEMNELYIEEDVTNVE